MIQNGQTRWGRIGAAIALLALGIAGYWQFFLRRPIGEGPAGPKVDRSLFRQPWSNREVLLVGLGDSITAGFGASPGKSYFQRLFQNPADEFPDLHCVSLSAVFPRARATNLAISGSTSPQHLRSQIPRLPHQPTNVLGIVVLTTGGNDLIHNYGRSAPVEDAMYGATWAQAEPWIARFAERLEALVTRITEAFPGGSHFFLATIYDPTDGLGDLTNAGLPAWPDALRIHDAYNRLLADCAARHANVHLVDIRSGFLGHGIHCTQFWREHYDAHDPHYWYLYNLEDPNDRGYDALRRLFLNAMAKVLGV